MNDTQSGNFKIERKLLTDITNEAWDKLMAGRARYGDSYKVANLRQDIFEELEDIPNYCFLIHQRLFVEERGLATKKRYDREDYDAFMQAVFDRIDSGELLSIYQIHEAWNSGSPFPQERVLYELAAWSFLNRILLAQVLKDMGSKTSAELLEE